MKAHKRIAIIGGGIAGMACARRLVEAGHHALVIDKARRPGGRITTRHSDFGSFDHGAQYFTVETPEFAAVVRDLERDGVVAPWRSRIARIDWRDTVVMSQDVERFVGIPSMSAISRALARDLVVRSGFLVTGIARDETGWTVTGEQGEWLGPFDHVVVALPAPQAEALLPSSSALRELASHVAMVPCIALMVAFRGRVPVDFDAAFVESLQLSWVARDSSKPGRVPGERWVMHAAPDWSDEWFTAANGVLQSMMLASFAECLGAALPAVSGSIVHRWSHARPAITTAARSLVDADHGLALAGDWCVGARVEDAWLSGRAAANRLLSAGTAHQAGGLGG